jgi:C-lobe and N-lobe beta barrels of Tf-binding protein B
MKQIRLLSTVGLVSLLAACGGGGGGGSTPTVTGPTASSASTTPSSTTTTPAGGTTSTTPTPTPTTATLNASSTQAHMDPSTGTPTGGSILDGSVTQSDPGAAGTLTVNIDASGNVTSVAIAPGPNGGLDGLPATITDPTLTATIGASKAGAASAIVSADGTSVVPMALTTAGQVSAADIANAVIAAGLDTTHPLAILAQAQSFSSYGVWSKNDAQTGLQLIGVFATGQETPVASMPKTGAASYSGTAIGFASVANPAFPGTQTNAFQSLAYSAPVGLRADFGAGSMLMNVGQGTTQRMDEIGTVGTLAAMTGTGTITGNKFANSLAGGGLTGTANGTFFGPAANEVAGTFQAAGGTTKVIASFGAK